MLFLGLFYLINSPGLLSDGGSDTIKTEAYSMRQILATERGITVWRYIISPIVIETSK